MLGYMCLLLFFRVVGFSLRSESVGFGFGWFEDLKVEGFCMSLGVNFIECLGGFGGICFLMFDFWKFEDLLCWCFVVFGELFKLCDWMFMNFI